MAPSRGVARTILVVCVVALLLEQGLAKFKYGRGIKHRRKRLTSTSTLTPTSGQNITTTESIVDPNEIWDPVRVLPRSKVLVYAYLKMHEVVPNIIPKAPRHAIEVVYANSIVVDFGNELWTHQINVMPHRTVWPVENGAYYTIALFTPDYPTKDNPSEIGFLFWFVANVFDTCVTATGTTVAEYMTPKVEGKIVGHEDVMHRFIFFVYKQPKGIMPYHLPYMPADSHFDTRKCFNITKLAEKHGLGIPVAANLFQMQRLPPNNTAETKPKKRPIEL